MEHSYKDAIKKLPPVFWNGEPCTIDFIAVRLIEQEHEPFKMPWYLPFIGTERQAIAVTSQNQRFLIDNEDGLGYMKVTKGGGMWQAGHKSYGAVVELDKVPAHLWNTTFSKEKNQQDEAITDDYWKEKDPEAFERKQHFKNMIGGLTLNPTDSQSATVSSFNVIGIDKSSQRKRRYNRRKH